MCGASAATLHLHGGAVAGELTIVDNGRGADAAAPNPAASATVWVGIDELLIGARSQDVEELTKFNEGPLPADWVGELETSGIAVTRDILREAAREACKVYSDRAGATY